MPCRVQLGFLLNTYLIYEIKMHHRTECRPVPKTKGHSCQNSYHRPYCCPCSSQIESTVHLDSELCPHCFCFHLHLGLGSFHERTRPL